MKKHKSDEQIYIDILMNHGKLSGNIRKLKYQCSIRSMDNLIHKLWKNSRNFRKRAGDSLLPQDEPAGQLSGDLFGAGAELGKEPALPARGSSRFLF